MLCTALVPVVSATTPATINLQEFYEDNGYSSTYVGAALSAEADKPVQDGVIGDDEYQIEYVVGVDGTKDVVRSGVSPTALLADYKEYVAHDDEWIYVAFDFVNGATDYRGRFYWNLSFIEDFTFDYAGGATANAAFTQNGHGIFEGWWFGGEAGDATTASNTAYSTRNNTVSFGTAPVDGTDFVLKVKNEVYTADGSYATTHQVYEFKVSKAWYATQVGLEGASDVKNLAWFTSGRFINKYASQYTQIGHFVSDTEKAALEETYGVAYTGNSAGSNSHICDDNALPRLFILDSDPRLNLKEFYDEHGYASTYVGAALSAEADKPVQDGVIGDDEYQIEYVVGVDGTKDVVRSGVSPTALLADYKEYVAHDDEWIYVAFDFVNGATDYRGRFYWNLSFIEDFTFDYAGGATANAAFTQNGHGIFEGWWFGGEAGDATTASNTAYSTRNNTVSFGTAPVDGTDFVLKVKNEVYTADGSYATTHQVYEFKVSKAWYATQVGLEGASDVKNLAWFTSGRFINKYASQYTQIGHFVSDTEKAALEETYGVAYTGNSAGSNSHICDDNALPRLFILDEAPTSWEQVAENAGLNIHVQPVTTAPILDGVISDNEYPTTRTSTLDKLLDAATQQEVQGTEIVEYFGHDAEYIYYAIQFEQATDRRYCWPQFKADNTFDIFNSSFNARSRYQACYNWTAEVGDINFSNDIDVTGGATWAAPVDEKDVFFFADKDRETNVKVYEFKFAKTYFATASNADVSDIKVVPYYTYFHAATALGTIVTEDIAAAITKAGGTAPAVGSLCYNFMVLDGEYEDLHKVEDRIAITTYEKASIRLSPTNSGLRFKSEVSTADLQTLMSKYEYVKVGTIIAPKDFELTLNGILENDEMVADTHYINVEADINNPIGHDKSITVFAGSITNFKGTNAGRTFAAVGYIAYSADGENWTYVYSGTTAERSAAQVAQLALEEGKYAEDQTALDILNAYAAVEYVAPEAN